MATRQGVGAGDIEPVYINETGERQAVTGGPLYVNETVTTTQDSFANTPAKLEM